MSAVLYNGDCISLMKDIPDNSIDAVICDLPYGTTRNKWDVVIPFEELWPAYNRIVKDGGAIILTASQPFTSVLIMSNLDHFKYEWIWRKTLCSGSINAKIMPLKQHESVLVFSGNGRKVNYYPIMEKGTPYRTSAENFDASNYNAQERPEVVNEGFRYPTSVLDISNPRIKGGHPTQKPVSLMEYFVETYTLEGETVLDNCMGSGATGVACINMNRQFIGMELETEYYDFAVQRIENAKDEYSAKESKESRVHDFFGTLD